MTIEYLSYYLNENTPLYGGERAISIKNKGLISEGSSSNTKTISFPNHSGTHIDFPNHFSDTGKKMNDYPASFWQFKEVFCIDYIAKQEEIITEEIFKDCKVSPKIDLLIINTSFGRYRKEKAYWNNNPGISPGLALFLRTRFPNIKAIGFDFISLSSYQNRLLGREAHKEFLIEHNILIIEDMKLDTIARRKIKSVTALPLQIDEVDGSPITIIAEYE